MTSRTRCELIYSKHVKMVVWPAVSPDVNPIKHVSDILRRATARSQP